MSMSLVSALDVSVYDGLITKGDWQVAKTRYECELAIVGLWHGARANKYADETLHAAQSVNLPIAAYVAVNSRNVSECLSIARASAGKAWKSLKFVALDCELDTVTEEQVRLWETELRKANQTPILYTGRWFWYGHLGNPEWASHLPLWDSLYDGKRDLDRDRKKTWRPYGGWTGRVGKQYWDGTSRFPFDADLSVFDREWLAHLG